MDRPELIDGLKVAEHAPQPPQRCIGIDPGLNRTGYAVLDPQSGGPVLLEAGLIRSTRGGSLAERVGEIGIGLREVLDEFSPGVLAIEQVFSLARNPKSAILMAHARGAILFAAVEREVEVVHYTPTQVKKLLTGSGRASKEQIQHVVQAEFKLERLPEPHDVADACAVGLCHVHTATVTWKRTRLSGGNEEQR